MTIGGHLACVLCGAVTSRGYNPIGVGCLCEHKPPCSWTEACRAQLLSHVAVAGLDE